MDQLTRAENPRTGRKQMSPLWTSARRCAEKPDKSPLPMNPNGRSSLLQRLRCQIDKHATEAFGDDSQCQ